MAILTIPTPAASVCWVKGSEHTISFTSDLEQPYNVDIFLYIDGEPDPTATIVLGYTIDGSPEEYAWTPSTGITDRVDYRIYIDDGDGVLVGNVFTLCSYTSAFTETLTLSESSSSVTFSSPTDGETWYKSSGYTISFSAEPTGSTINLLLYKGTIGSGSLQATIVNGLSCTGSTMTYPYTPTTGLTNAADYYIQGDYGSTTGYSANFAIRTYVSSSTTDTFTLSDTLTSEDVLYQSLADTLTFSDSVELIHISDPSIAKETLDLSTVSYRVKFYIQDSNKEYVDFSNHLSHKLNKLSDIGTVTHSTESTAMGGVFISSVGDITLDNSTGFWDNPSDWADLKTEYRNTAVFETSKNKREINLVGSLCKIVIETLQSGGTVKEETIAVFRISDLSTDNTSGIATLSIESLSQRLKRADASKCRNGKSWYQNRSIVFLMKKLLALEFGDKQTGALPSSFSFPDQISLPTFDGNRALSSFGTPPEYDLTSAEWKELGLICRAIVWSEDFSCLFLGCDNELWKYYIEQDAYQKVGEVASGYNIKRLWVNGADSNYIYGAAWGDPSDTAKTVTVNLFSSSGSTDITNITGVTDVFTGEFCYRNGAVGSFADSEWASVGRTYLSFSALVANDYSENVMVPFNQYLKMAHDPADDDTYMSLHTGATISSVGYTIESLPLFSDTVDINKTWNSGYYNILKQTHSPDWPVPPTESAAPFDLRISYSQRGCIELLSSYNNSSGVFLATATSSAGTDTINYKVYDFDSSALKDIYLTSATTMNNYKRDTYPSDSPFYPTCCAVVKDFSGTVETDSVIVGGVCWCSGDISSGYIPARTYLLKVSDLEHGTVPESPYASATALYDSSADADAEYYKTFLDILSYSTFGFFVSFLNRNKIGKSDFCGIGRFTVSSFGDTKSFSTIPLGLVLGSLNNAYFTTNGSLYKYNQDGSLSVCDGGANYVESDPNLASNLAIVPYAEINAIDTERTRTEDIIFGVSAPTFPKETQEHITIGKYYLWKYDNYLSDRIELAEFTDMKIWDALTQLCGVAAGYSMGFNNDDNGSFFLSNKDSSTYTVAMTISDDLIENNMISVNKSRGLDEIFNYASIIPSYAKMGEVKPELYIAPRATDNDEKYVVKLDDIGFDVRVLYNINLRLVCTRGGYVTKAYSELTDCPLFKYQVYERNVEAITVGDTAASSSSIIIASNFRGGNPARKDDNTIWIIEDAINIGDYATFVDPTTQEEQIDKITNVSGETLTLEDALDFAIVGGTVFSISHPYDVTDNLISDFSDGGVATITNSGTTVSTIYVDSIRDISQYTVVSVGETNTFLRIVNDPSGMTWNSANSGYTVTVAGGTISPTIGDKVKAWYSPCKAVGGTYEYFEIGGTNIFCKIEPSTDNYTNTQFKQGDRITVSSEGLVIEQSDMSNQLAYDMTSIDKYGRLEYSFPSNKFIRRTLAKHYARKIVNDFKDPHYILEIEARLYPLLKLLDSNGLCKVKLIDSKLFKNYPEVIGYIRQIQHNLRSGKTNITIRCDDPY